MADEYEGLAGALFLKIKKFNKSSRMRTIKRGKMIKFLEVRTLTNLDHAWCLSPAELATLGKVVVTP